MKQMDLLGDDPVQRTLALLPTIWPTEDALALKAAMRDVKAASSCLSGDRLQKNMTGLGPLWGYFPHAMRVKVGGVSLADKLADPLLARQVAEKTVAYCEKHERGQISHNRIRQSLKAYAGHHVSNFRPVAARDLILHLVGPYAKVFDPCAGWGGRWLGAYGAECIKYDGVDASLDTVNSFYRMFNATETGWASVRHGAIEDTPVWDGYDLAFTSPPYFDAERYSDDPEQSWSRYPAYSEWRDGFLRKLCAKMAFAIRPGGYVALNIADVQKLPLCDDANGFLRALGLEERPMLRYVLSSIAGKGEKYEPIFIYRKPR